MTDSVLGITGSTGRLGGRIARRLAAAGVPQRLLVRDPARAPQLPASTVAAASDDDATAERNALPGLSTDLMVSGAEHPDRVGQHRTFVDAAVDAGVEQIVYTSFFGASADCTFTLGRDHWATEEHIRSRGTAFTFLRDNFYLDFLPLTVGEDGVIRGPAGTGRVSAVARADVARVAAAVLLDPESHRAATYDLTGPESLSLNEAAVIIGEATGREVTFHDETLDEAYESRKRWEAPDWQYDAWVSTYAAIAAGEVEGVTGDVRRVTGQAPIGLRELLAQP